MGGALSLYLSYKYKLSLAGCCVMSSFLNKNSLIYEVCILHVSYTNLIQIINFHIIFFKINIFGIFFLIINIQNLQKNPNIRTPPLLQFHGIEDTLIPIQWGRESYNNLIKLGVIAQFIPLDNVDHELGDNQIQFFKKWLLNILPEK